MGRGGEARGRGYVDESRWYCILYQKVLVML